MGLISSRLNLEALPSSRRRSQQEDTMYSYSLNKNYFSNFFIMGGERFDLNDPDYLFGDNCDLNFLSCTKPYSLPYKKAQQNLLASLAIKQKVNNKVSIRANRLSSPFDLLTRRHRHGMQSRKQDAQTQTLPGQKGSTTAPEASRPLVMLINIRKETLRLVKSSIFYHMDSDQNSLTNNSASMPNNDVDTTTKHSTVKQKHVRQTVQNVPQQLNQSPSRSDQQSSSTGQASIGSVDKQENQGIREELKNVDQVQASKLENLDSISILSESSSSALSISTTKSGYTSVKDVLPSNCGSDDEDFEDALNDTTHLSNRDDDDNVSERTQQQRSLLQETRSTKEKENRDIRIAIKPSMDDGTSSEVEGDLSQKETKNIKVDKENCANSSRISMKGQSSIRRASASKKLSIANIHMTTRVYNIEFYFDSEVDCSIRIFYFCTREITSHGVTYKPQHPTYKSKTYTFKKGLNQKFEQQEHTFQPYLFDEDLLIYKPLDLDGNYNSGAVFPIVIHCVALEGPSPRQSHSLVATVEKSQLDESYSIKPLKQMIFVDGVQYILQDIYGIENKRLSSSVRSRQTPIKSSKPLRRSTRNITSSTASLHSNFSLRSNLDVTDNASMRSYDTSLGDVQYNQGSIVINNQYRSLSGEGSFECVICMSDERDTMLLPCRHLCLCGSCAQSLRYQANSCPICRCPFRAALNLRILPNRPRRQEPTANRPPEDNKLDDDKQNNSTSRRESVIIPLLLTSNQPAVHAVQDIQRQMGIGNTQGDINQFVGQTPSVCEEGETDRRSGDAPMQPVESCNSHNSVLSGGGVATSLEMRSMRNLVGRGK